MENFEIGYSCGLKVEEQYTGGLTVAGHRPIPIAFKYTEPLRPTRIPAAVETPVHTAGMDPKIHPMDFSVSTAVDEIDSSIQNRIVEAVEQLNRPGIRDAAVSDLENGKSIMVNK